MSEWKAFKWKYILITEYMESCFTTGHKSSWGGHRCEWRENLCFWRSIAGRGDVRNKRLLCFCYSQYCRVLRFQFGPMDLSFFNVTRKMWNSSCGFMTNIRFNVTFYLLEMYGHKNALYHVWKINLINCGAGEGQY